MKGSESISGFLKFLRECEEGYGMAKDKEGETDRETQDILHRLELCDDGHDDTARLAVALREVRRERRMAKDRCAEAEPVICWLQRHGSKEAVKSLEQLLGDVRKAEARVENRGYVEKTDILDKVFGMGRGRGWEGGRKAP